MSVLRTVLALSIALLAIGSCRASIARSNNRGVNTTSERRHIAGLHYPLKIDPRVDVPAGHRLLMLYPTLLNREAESLEYRFAFALVQGEVQSVRDVFYGLMGQPEFAKNLALHDAGAYVTRVYQYWLRRMPSAAEVQMWTSSLTAPTVQQPTVATPYTWYGLQEYMAQSTEYATNGDICPTGYYSLNAAVNPTALLMADLFNGTARLQLIGEAEQVNLDIESAMGIWDQKMPILENPDAWIAPSTTEHKFIAFTRSYRGNGNFYMTTVVSNDALNWTEKELIWQVPWATYYDGHIAVDHSVCPPRYILTMECSVNGSTASLCTAYTTTPSLPWTWSFPEVIVYGCRPGQTPSCNNNEVGSASTGVTLVDGHRKYMAWTNVVDGDPKIVQTYSQMTGPMANVSAYFGTIVSGTEPIRTLLQSQPGAFCTTSWDCNNKDKQDWKREGSHYYALFNGANYYRCGGTWGVSIARATEADATPYTDELPLLRGIPSVNHNSCGISYPVLNVINGELYVYYAAVLANSDHVTLRSKIVRI